MLTICLFQHNNNKEERKTSASTLVYCRSPVQMNHAPNHQHKARQAHPETLVGRLHRLHLSVYDDHRCLWYLSASHT